MINRVISNHQDDHPHCLIILFVLTKWSFGRLGPYSLHQNHKVHQLTMLTCACAGYPSSQSQKLRGLWGFRDSEGDPLILCPIIRLGCLGKPLAKPLLTISNIQEDCLRFATSGLQSLVGGEGVGGLWQERSKASCDGPRTTLSVTSCLDLISFLDWSSGFDRFGTCIADCG